MNKMLPIILVVVALVVGAGGAFFFLKGNNAGAAPKKPVLPTHNLPLDERTINLADTDAAHYLKVTMVLEVAGLGDIEKFTEEAKPQLMDRMIEVMSKQTYRTLLSPAGKKELKEKLMDSFNEVLEEEGWDCKDVLFTDFLME